jgi:hypothetical protein
MRTEAGFLRVGVDRTAELSQVKRVLAQRGLHAVSERYSFGHIALGAASEDERETAIRVISSRGVAFAEDASLDDLFAPARVALIDTLPESIEDIELFAFSRTAQGHALGCITAGRVLPDGTALPFVLDVTQLGERACVSAIRSLGRGTLQATVSWPLLSIPDSPASLEVVLTLDRPRLDQPAPLLRRARVDMSVELFEREKQRLASLPAQPTFGQRQAIAVARAALALLRGESSDAQLGVYREALGSVRGGSPEQRMAEDTLAHISRGWVDREQKSDDDAAAQEAGAVSPAEVIEEATEHDALIIEPESAAPRSASPELAPAAEGN